jgi:hypothetical protein
MSFDFSEGQGHNKKLGVKADLLKGPFKLLAIVPPPPLLAKRPYLKARREALNTT